MSRKVLCFTFVLTACAFTLAAAPVGFTVTNLVSDQSGVALQTDSNLVNAWGLSTSATSPFWVGDNGTGLSTLYNTAGMPQSLVVTIPGEGSVTGVTFAGGTGFNGNLFLFASEDGTVSGWRSALGTNAEVLATANDSNVYKGLDFAVIGGHGYAFAANFRAGTVDVYKGDAGAPSLAGNFTDPNLPSGYAPFNVAVINGSIYVSYAQQDAAKSDEIAGVGKGFVDRFDLNGSFQSRVVSGGALNAPWGLALAPAGFGDLGGSLLVGNFGDGLIHAYNPTSGAFVETLATTSGNPLTIDGLWALRFGNGGNGGTLGTLYFTAGPDGERHGLFGAINAVPEPSTWLLAVSALALLAARRWKCRAA